jgi:hypothetical protein
MEKKHTPSQSAVQQVISTIAWRAEIRRPVRLSSNVRNNAHPARARRTPAVTITNGMIPICIVSPWRVIRKAQHDSFEIPSQPRRHHFPDYALGSGCVHRVLQPPFVSFIRVLDFPAAS